MEEDRECKQKYLTLEIIDKGYDSETFTQFCESIKGTEIDLYTLEELHEIVKAFQSQHPNIENKDLEPDPVVLLPNTEEISVPESKADSSKQVQKLEVHKEFKPKTSENSAYSIEAVKMQDNDLSLEEVIDIELGPAEFVNGGIFSTAKCFYPLESKPFNSTVKRTVEDFVWIRQILSINFPGVYLPPNPPKRFKSSPDSYLKQKYFLEKFINCIARNPLLRRSSYLQTFLLEADYKKFAEAKKKSAKEKKIGRLEEFWTLDGTVICDPFNDESEKVTINEYINIVESMKKKIKRQSDTLISAFEDLSNQMHEISKSFEILENIQSFIPEITGTKPLYESLKLSIASWAMHELKNADILKEYFNMFFKYAYTEIQPIKELIKEKDLKNDHYEKSKAKLLAKKEKLWLSSDVNKWGLDNEDMWNASVLKNDKIAAFNKMLKKESIEVEKIKDEFAYYNFQARSEVRRFLLDNQLIENLHFTAFARKMCTQTTNIHVNWGELIANLSRIRCENIPSRSYISKCLKSN